MTNGFALNHDKNLQIYYFCVKRQAKNDFLKDVESVNGLTSRNTKHLLTCTIWLSTPYISNHLALFK